jgi:hypothetical protein
MGMEFLVNLSGVVTRPNQRFKPTGHAQALGCFALWF